MNDPSATSLISIVGNGLFVLATIIGFMKAKGWIKAGNEDVKNNTASPEQVERMAVQIEDLQVFKEVVLARDGITITPEESDKIRKLVRERNAVATKARAQGSAWTSEVTVVKDQKT